MKLNETYNLITVVCLLSQSLAATVVQVMQASPPAHNVWSKKCTGVLGLIKDNPRRSYFIRVYNLKVIKKSVGNMIICSHRGYECGYSTKQRICKHCSDAVELTYSGKIN